MFTICQKPLSFAPQRETFFIVTTMFTRHVTTMVEELLVLLITVVAERHSPGVGRGVDEELPVEQL